jgi:hypothetical protein
VAKRKGSWFCGGVVAVRRRCIGYIGGGVFSTPDTNVAQPGHVGWQSPVVRPFPFHYFSSTDWENLSELFVSSWIGCCCFAVLPGLFAGASMYFFQNRTA